MQITVLSENEVDKLLDKWNYSLNPQANQTFIKAYENAFQISFQWAAISEKETILLALVSDNSHPFITYNPIYISPKFIKNNGETSPICNDAIALIKSTFNNTGNIFLSNELFDIRPFSFNNYTIRKRYTYIIEEAYSPENQILKKIKKANEANLTFNECTFHDIGFELIVQTAKQLSFYNKNIFQKLDKFCKSTGSDSIIRCFEILHNGKCEAFQVMLYYKKQALFWEVGTSDFGKENAANVLLTHQIILKLQDEGFDHIDLYGANIKGVAIFKASFGGKLIAYYLLNSAVKKSIFQKIINRLK